MREDPEVRELRDRVRMLEGQLANRRGGNGNAGCVLAFVAAGAVAVVGAALAVFLFVGRSPAPMGQPSGPSQAVIDAETQAQQARLEAQAAAMREAQAAAGTAAVGDPPAGYVDDDDVYDGRVTATEGSSHVHVGDACRVDLEWTTDPGRNCRALVDCGERRVYGDVHQGWLPCTATAADGLIRGHDDEATPTDGDPRLSIDRVENRVTISDESPHWSITMSIADRAEPE
jgi:hypothetical protein